WLHSGPICPMCPDSACDFQPACARLSGVYSLDMVPLLCAETKDLRHGTLVQTPAPALAPGRRFGIQAYGFQSAPSTASVSPFFLDDQTIALRVALQVKRARKRQSCTSF